MTKKNESEIDLDRRDFIVSSAKLLGGLGIVCASTPFIKSWSPSDKALATGAPVEVDLSNLAPGSQITVEWRGNPVWVVRRTKEMLDSLDNLTDELSDPYSKVDQQPEYAKNIYRSINPEYLVLIGICTHLGCSPKYEPQPQELGPNWPGGFFCPCHGSSFDLAGRVFKNVPAPINLAVPPYKFLNKHTILIGEKD